MSVTRVTKDLDNLTVTLVAEFDAPIDRVWELWADPRRLERWWGPPGYPATFETHHLTSGGQASYLMAGPDGDTHRGWWRFISVDPPSGLEFTDGFADQDGKPMTNMPVTTVRVQLSERGARTRMEIRSSFASREDMEKYLDTGTAEGMQEAVDQMDALIAG